MKITLVGSVAFADKFVENYNELRKLGHDPIIHEDMFEYSKTSWEEVHIRALREHADIKRTNDYIKWWHNEIMKSDAIVVQNYDKKGITGYIGGNTLMEMGFAHTAGKSIYLINPLPTDVPYADEIAAMVCDDDVIHGDLTLIG